MSPPNNNDIVSKFNLKPIQAAELEIYTVFSEICKRNGLRYYATDGTALGAVRHNGFIPWDDDFDVSMPRPDYERFRQIAKNVLPSHLKFVDFKNTPEFKFLFGKIQDCRQEKISEIERKTGRFLSNGIFIDIFPIDGYPKSLFPRLWARIRTFVLIQANVFYTYHFHSLPLSGKVRWLFGFLVSPVSLLSKGITGRLRILENILKENEYDKSDFVGRSECRLTIFRKPALMKNVFGCGVEHVFEGGMIRVPEYCEQYLENEFGNWRRFPPETERCPSHEYSERTAWWLGPTQEQQKSR